MQPKWLPSVLKKCSWSKRIIFSPLWMRMRSLGQQQVHQKAADWHFKRAFWAQIPSLSPLVAIWSVLNICDILWHLALKISGMRASGGALKGYWKIHTLGCLNTDLIITTLDDHLVCCKHLWNPNPSSMQGRGPQYIRGNFHKYQRALWMGSLNPDPFFSTLGHHLVCFEHLSNPYLSVIGDRGL